MTLHRPRLFALALGAALLLASSLAAADKTKHSIVANRKAGTLDQVTVSCQVEGDKTERRAKADDPKKTVPLKVDCQLAYAEKTLDWDVGEAKPARTVRYYDKAAADLELSDKTEKKSLTPDRRLIVADVADSAQTLFSPKGPLTLDELDTIDMLAPSQILDRLLPSGRVAVGDEWQHGDGLIAMLLGLDQVRKNELKSKLTEVTDAVIRMELGGEVTGRKYDQPIALEVRGRYRFDRRLQRIDWLGMTVKEKSEPGLVQDGFDVAIRLSVRILPLPNSPQLAVPALKGLGLEPTEQLLKLRCPLGKRGWSVLHDRRWFVTAETATNLDFTLLDDGANVALCRIPLTATKAKGPLPKLDEFQQDVATALGKNFEELVVAGEGATPEGYRLLRVEASGKNNDTPFRWHYYHLSDKGGDRAAIIFMLDQQRLERLKGADLQLVNAFRFGGE